MLPTVKRFIGLLTEFLKTRTYPVGLSNSKPLAPTSAICAAEGRSAPALVATALATAPAYLAGLEATVGARFDEAVAALRGAGVHIVPVNLVDHFERTAVSNMTVVLFETPHTLVSYFRGTGLAGLPADLLAASELTKSPDVAGVLAYIHGNPVPVVDYQPAAANRCQLRRQFILQLGDSVKRLGHGWSRESKNETGTAASRRPCLRPEAHVGGRRWRLESPQENVGRAN